MARTSKLHRENQGPQRTHVRQQNGGRSGCNCSQRKLRSVVKCYRDPWPDTASIARLVLSNLRHQTPVVSIIIPSECWERRNNVRVAANSEHWRSHRCTSSGLLRKQHTHVIVEIRCDFPPPAIGSLERNVTVAVSSVSVSGMIEYTSTI